MYRFLQKNKKKLLAIFAAGLMIVFILPPMFGQGGQPDNPLLGRIGDEKIYAQDVARARMQWESYSEIVIPSPNEAGQTQWIPIHAALLQPQAAARIQDRPAMYFLLRREAREMGIRPSEDDLDSVLSQVAISMRDGRLLAYDNLGEHDAQRIRAQVSDLLSVLMAFQRAASVVKISEPMRQQAIARQLQSISVDVVEVDSINFAEKVPTPTAEQLQEQFKKHADVIAPAADEPAPADNPFAFGYMYPNRVKLQYIAIDRQQLRDLVRKSRTDYEWEVQAQRYYRQNQSRFPATAPAATEPAATEPADGATTAPATQPQATAPTTQPFNEVRDEIMELIIEPQVEKLAAQVQATITSNLNRDFVAFQQATGAASTTAPATRPATAPSPSTPLGAPYESFDYLQRLAELVQKQHGVLPTIVDLADSYHNRQQLAQLEGIGTADFRGIPFPFYAIDLARPLLPQGAQPQVSLRLLEPSQALSNPPLQTTYIFRLTEIQPAHRPAEMSQVAGDVERDWRKAQAYELARKDAEQILANARSSDLSSAANQADRPLVTTGFFRNDPTTTIPNYELQSPAKERFIDQSFNLLAQASDQNPHPLALVEMHRAGKLAVARLAQVRADWFDETMLSFYREGLQRALAGDLEESLYDQWFDYESIIQRLNYRPEGEDDA